MRERGLQRKKTETTVEPPAPVALPVRPLVPPAAVAPLEPAALETESASLEQEHEAKAAPAGHQFAAVPVWRSAAPAVPPALPPALPPAAPPPAGDPAAGAPVLEISQPGDP